jgi:hypothetical protein
MDVARLLLGDGAIAEFTEQFDKLFVNGCHLVAALNRGCANNYDRKLRFGSGAPTLPNVPVQQRRSPANLPSIYGNVTASGNEKPR